MFSAHNKITGHFLNQTRASAVKLLSSGGAQRFTLITHVCWFSHAGE